MSGNDIISGYLDVKISARSRRGFTPWKVSSIYFFFVRKEKTIRILTGMAEAMVRDQTIG